MMEVGDMLEKHHKVQVLDEAIEASVRLSHRYIQGRQLPDKSVSLLDTACSRVAVGQHAVPAEVDDTESGSRLSPPGSTSSARDRRRHRPRRRIGEVQARQEAEKQRLATLEAGWKKEKDLVEKILDIRHKLRGPSRTEPVEQTHTPAAAAAAAAAKEDPIASQQLSEQQRATLLSDLKALQAQLAEVQGETPLILPSVDAQAVAAVVADWTGIPVGKMVKNEIEAVLRLADTLNQRIIGQRHALEAIAKRIQTSRAGLENPSKPIGVFLLAGTSGVGKTETALALAEALYGGEDNVVTINMSEYKEEHKVATLMGPPPGYVGFGSGGVLTEAIRRKPYSVLLLDEIEKAHPSIHEVFFQVFDKGTMKDSEGTEVSFKNTIILLTTNVGSDLIMNMCKDPDLLPDTKSLSEALRAPLLQKFPAALLGRMFTIPYYPLSDTMIREITRLQPAASEAHPREPQSRVRGRPGGLRPHRRAVHRGRVRRTSHRRHPHPDSPPHPLQRVPHPNDGRGGDQEGNCWGSGRGLLIFLRVGDNGRRARSRAAACGSREECGRGGTWGQSGERESAATPATIAPQPSPGHDPAGPGREARDGSGLVGGSVPRRTVPCPTTPRPSGCSRSPRRWVRTSSCSVRSPGARPSPGRSHTTSTWSPRTPRST